MRALNDDLGEAAFALVEVPGDFVKNAGEEERTGLPLGSPISSVREASALYVSGADAATRYILHTEPGLSRKGSAGRVTPALSWFDRGWVTRFVMHVEAVAECIGQYPEIVEVHPGKRQRGRNNVDSLAGALADLHTQLSARFGRPVRLLLENRTDNQIVGSGDDIRAFWDAVGARSEPPAAWCRVTLDVQQLFTVTRGAFEEQLRRIPPECLGGVHVHRRHRIPASDDGIQWEAVAEYLRPIPDLIVLPEVHHLQHTRETYLFCKRVLGL